MLISFIYLLGFHEISLHYFSSIVSCFVKIYICVYIYIYWFFFFFALLAFLSFTLALRAAQIADEYHGALGSPVHAPSPGNREKLRWVE